MRLCRKSLVCLSRRLGVFYEELPVPPSQWPTDKSARPPGPHAILAFMVYLTGHIRWCGSTAGTAATHCRRDGNPCYCVRTISIDALGISTFTSRPSRLIQNVFLICSTLHSKHSTCSEPSERVLTFFS